VKFAFPRWGYLALVGSLAVAFLGRVVLQRMARPRPWFNYSASPLSQAAYAALAARPGWAASSLRVAEGVSLNGLMHRPLQQDAPWVLFFPGNDATQLARAQTVLERTKSGHDWGLAVYASRGYDSSGGTPSPAALGADGLRVFETLLREERLRPEQVHVVAFSLGGFAAIQAVGQAARTNRKPGSLSLLASVAKVAMVHSDWRARISIGDIYDVVPALSAVSAPVLVVQGAADEVFGDVQQGRTIAAHLGERAHYLELPGAGHNSLLETEAAISAVRALIEANSAR
jgi:pimeloyl-ACP methyl ester carboxylesterase